MAASIDSQITRITKALRAASPVLIAVALPCLILLALLWANPFSVASYAKADLQAHTMSYAELSSQDPSPTPACIQCDGADSDIDRRLDSLAPSFLLSVQGLLQALQSHGLEFEIIETHRSFERQSQLWQQGRHPGSPGPIVTAARPGTSLHEIGLAIDLAPRVDGKLNWDLSNPIVHHAFQALGQHAKARGLQWGGDWAIADYGHIEEALIHNPLTGKP